MTADEFTAFVRYVRDEFGVFENSLAKSMGFSRQVLSRWRKKGSPAYADLVAAAVIAGLSPWRPELEHRPNPALRQAAHEPEHSSHTES
jgi:hypothetical protein